MEITQDNTNGIFYIGDRHEHLGELIYRIEGDHLIIDHTEVSDSLKGKGAGKQLIAAAVAYARKNSLKIVPLCTFASAVIKRVKEFHQAL
jgi:uncharacterized protein